MGGEGHVARAVVALVGIVLIFQAGWGEARCTVSRSSSNTTKTENRHLKIAAFNVRAFGENKISDEFATKYITKIVQRYDVVLIQEVRDKCEKSIRTLKKGLKHHNFVISERLGRTVSKEQYAFFYRTDRVLVLEEYQYPDPEDHFEREPFVIKIAPAFSKDDFVSLIALHAKPKNATEEIGHLPEVLKAVTKEHPHSELIVMGDLNADCDYSTYAKRIAANDTLTMHYHWLIGEGVDTTTKDSTQCAYDRIIVKDLEDSYVVEGTAKIYNYTRWYHLNETQALKISDHYPVEVQLEF